MSAAVILVVVVVAVWVILLTTATVIAAGRPRRRAELEKRFGPQWARTVEAQRSRKGAEADRQRRIAFGRRLHIRPLSAVEACRYQRDWQAIQASFVDMPDVSLRQADGLVTEVMRERGYPMDDFDDQVELSSVEHPEIVEHHWRAHSVVVASQRRQASTDDARRAFVSYRMLVTTCWPAATRTGRESNRAPVGEQEGILTNEALHRDRI